MSEQLDNYEGRSGVVNTEQDLAISVLCDFEIIPSEHLLSSDAQYENVTKLYEIISKLGQTQEYWA